MNLFPVPFLVRPNSDTEMFFKVYQTGDLANLSGLEDHERYWTTTIA